MSMFASLLGQLEKKRAGKSLDEQLAHLVGQIRLTGKPGKLTLTVNVKPKDHDGSLVDVSSKIVVSAPEVATKGALFFTTDDGLLSRTDPNQRELEFEQLDGGKAGEGTPATTTAPTAATAS